MGDQEDHHIRRRWTAAVSNVAWSVVRLVLVTVAGAALLVAGVVMLVTPGPGLLAIVAGLAVLSREYNWARRLRDQAAERLRDVRGRLPGWARSSPDDDRIDVTREPRSTVRRDRAA